MDGVFWSGVFLLASIVALFVGLWYVSRVPKCYGEHRDTATRCWGCEFASNCREDTDDESSCQHTVTKGRVGETGSWCAECGEKIYEVEERQCRDCSNAFIGAPNYAGCRVYLMAITPGMRVTYKIKHGTCFKPRLEEDTDDESQ